MFAQRNFAATLNRRLPKQRTSPKGTAEEPVMSYGACRRFHALGVLAIDEIQYLGRVREDPISVSGVHLEDRPFVATG